MHVFRYPVVHNNHLMVSASVGHVTSLLPAVGVWVVAQEVGFTQVEPRNIQAVVQHTRGIALSGVKGCRWQLEPHLGIRPRSLITEELSSDYHNHYASTISQQKWKCSYCKINPTVARGDLKNCQHIKSNRKCHWNDALKIVTKVHTWWGGLKVFIIH